MLYVYADKLARGLRKGWFAENTLNSDGYFLEKHYNGMTIRIFKLCDNFIACCMETDDDFGLAGDFYSSGICGKHKETIGEALASLKKIMKKGLIALEREEK